LQSHHDAVGRTAAIHHGETDEARPLRLEEQVTPSRCTRQWQAIDQYGQYPTSARHFERDRIGLARAIVSIVLSVSAAMRRRISTSISKGDLGLLDRRQPSDIKRSSNYLDEQKLSKRKMSVNELLVPNIDPGLAGYLRATGEA
jgi:hypothetical protein